MNEAQISQYITDMFVGVNVEIASGDSFFSYDPIRTYRRITGIRLSRL